MGDLDLLDFLADLYGGGVTLQVRGDKLRVNAPKNYLNFESWEILTARKADILALLQPDPLTIDELATHLFDQAEKLSKAARQAERANDKEKAGDLWARWARLFAAAMIKWGIEGYIPWDEWADSYQPPRRLQLPKRKKIERYTEEIPLFAEAVGVA